MIRITSLEANYKPVIKFSENRYRISFDKVPVESGIATWSVQDYSVKPTTEDVQHDVINYTIQRYVNEGLQPPKPEDIDVSDYIIE